MKIQASRSVRLFQPAFTGIVFCLVTAVSARADFVFDFNSLLPSSGNNSSNIATYMDGILGCVNCVTVTGAATDRTYNGDGHVVGPVVNNAATSRTLGNTDGATDNSSTATATTNDTFLSNVTDGKSTVSSEITISFSGIVLNGPISFDYEIFPDFSCQSKTNCSGGAPDFAFAVNGNTASPVFTMLGVFPSSTGTDGSSTHSPASGMGTEQSAQYIGTYSGTLTNVTELDFLDWPAAIGVDNLKFTTNTVPEPRGEAFLLAGLLLAALAGTKLVRARAKS